MTEPRHDKADDDTAAKDSRGSIQLPAAESTLTSEVLDLLTAIRDAVDLPLPSIADADDRAWHRLMHHRLYNLYVVLDVALDPQWRAALDLVTEAANIRARTADSPVVYAVYKRRPDGDQG